MEAKLLLPTRSSSGGYHQGQGTSAAATQVKVPAAIRVKNKVKVPACAKGPAISNPTEVEVLLPTRSCSGCYHKGQGTSAANTNEAKNHKVNEATTLPRTEVKVPDGVKGLAASDPTEVKVPMLFRSSPCCCHQIQCTAASSCHRQGQGPAAAIKVIEVKAPNIIKVKVASSSTDGPASS